MLVLKKSKRSDWVASDRIQRNPSQRFIFSGLTLRRAANNETEKHKFENKTVPTQKPSFQDMWSSRHICLTQENLPDTMDLEFDHFLRHTSLLNLQNLGRFICSGDGTGYASSSKAQAHKFSRGIRQPNRRWAISIDLHFNSCYLHSPGGLVIGLSRRESCMCFFELANLKNDTKHKLIFESPNCWCQLQRGTNSFELNRLKRDSSSISYWHSFTLAKLDLSIN